MLFSRMLALPKARRMEMERTEMGIDAATVSPARRPTYTVTAPNKTPKMPPRTSARAESSGRVSVVGTKGLNVGLGGVDVAMMTRLPLAQALFSLEGSVSARGRRVAVASLSRRVLDLARWSISVEGRSA